MTPSPNRTLPRTRAQEGYALLVVLLVFSVLMLTLAKAIPDWKTSIQREREAREIDHAREYRTAIRRYFHKYGRYPPSIDAMVQKDGQGLRYLREAWPDPLSQSSQSADPTTGSDSANSGGWQILHYGQADNAKIVDQPPQAALNGGGTSNIAGPGLSSGQPGEPPGGQVGGPPAGLGAGTGGPGGPGGVGGLGGVSGIGSGGGMNQGSGTPGNSVGGGPVIGVASGSKTPGVHEFNGFSSPNDWQFVYNYAQDPTLRVTGGGAGTGGTPGSGNVTPGGRGGPGTVVH
jgi:type II secretory pathway pseudopilin PulG